MLEIIQSGGPLMIPLIICGLLSVGLSIERFLVLNSLPDEEESKEELENLEKALLQEGQESAVQICENGKGALNFVFASLLKRYNTLMIEQEEFKATNEEIVKLGEVGGGGEMGRFLVMQKEIADTKDELVIETEESARSYLGKHLPIINTIGNIAPLIGLLGTITGMIVAFESIAASGAGDPKVVAGGISQALVTTATGLIVAIPSIVFYRYLARTADRSLERVEVYGHAYANALIMSGRKTNV